MLVILAMEYIQQSMNKQKLTTILSKTGLLFFLIFVHSISYGQYKEQLKKYYQTSDLDKKAALGLEIWSPLMRDNLDSLRIIGFDLVLQGVEKRNSFATNVGKRALGSALIRTGEQDKGIKFLLESLKYFEESGDQVIITETLNEIGNAYMNKGLPLMAEKYYLKSLKAGKNSPDPTSSFLAEINLGQAYIGLKNFDKATAIIQHYKKEALKHGKLESVSNAYALLGTIEQQQKNIPLAMEYFQKSADFGLKSTSKAQVAHSYNNLAIVYFEKGEIDKTLEYFIKALDIRMETNNAKYICESYFNIGGLYFEMGKYEDALVYYEKSLDFAQKRNLLRDEMDALFALSELYEVQKKSNLSLLYLHKYIDLQDSYYTTVAEESSLSDELLESIMEMELSNDMKDQQMKLVESELAQERVWYVVYIIAGLTFTILLILFVFKKKIN